MPPCTTIETVQLPDAGSQLPSFRFQRLPVATTLIVPHEISAHSTPAAIATGIPRPVRRASLMQTVTGPIGTLLPRRNYNVGASTRGGGLNDLGYTLFCHDFNAVKDNLKAAVDSAVAQNVPPTDAGLIAAQAFLQAYSDPIDVVIPWIGNDCQKMIDEGNKNLAAVARSIAAAGGAAPNLPRPFLDPTQSQFSLSTLLSAKVLIPAAVIVGAITLGPSIAALVRGASAARRARHVSGLGHYRRRRKR